MLSQNFPFLTALVLALFLMILGRSTAARGTFSWPAMFEGVAGASLFLWAAVSASRKTAPEPAAEEWAELKQFLRSILKTRQGHVALLLAGSGATQGAAVKLNTSLPGSDPGQWTAFFCWLASVSLFLLGCRLAAPPASNRLSIGKRLIASRKNLFLIGGLTLLAFALRAVARAEIPYPLAGDEASVGMGGLAIITGRVTNMFGTGWSSQPNLSFLLPGLFQALFGADIDGLRLFPAVAGTLAIPLVYLLGSEVWDRRVGVLAALYLTTYHYHIQFSRIAVNNVVDATLFTAAFYLLWRAFRTNSPFDYGAAGVVSGLGLYSYAGGRYLIVLILLAVLFQLVQERQALKNRAGGLAALLGGMVVATLPMALYFSQHTDQFNARMNQVAVFQNGWLQAQMKQPGVTLAGIMVDHLWRTLFTFIYVPATGGFYNSPQPLLDGAAGVCFTMGVAWAFWHWRQPRYFMLLIWFFSMVLGAALTVDLPNAARMVAVIPAVTLFVVIGLMQLLNVIHSSVRISTRAIDLGAGFAIVAMCLLSLSFYFLQYVPKNYFADANSEVGMEVGYYLRALGPNYKAYFFGQPRMFFNFPSIEYLRRGVTGVDGPAVLPAGFVSKLPRDQPAVLIFIPERAKEAEEVRQARPDARLLTFPRKTKSETLFIAVELPASSSGMQ